MGIVWLWWLLLLLGVVAVTVGLVLARRAGGGGTSRGDTPSERSPARQILDERFARGEIAEEEYRTRRGELDER